MDVPEIEKAVSLIRAAEKEVMDYAAKRGLPLSFVDINRGGGRYIRVRLGSYRNRVLLNSFGANKRNLTETSVSLGPELYALIDEAADAWKDRR